MQDLNNLISSNCGWTLEDAVAINNKGQIVGYGINPSGQTDVFLLTPTPEPSTLALLTVGAISLLVYARRRHFAKTWKCPNPLRSGMELTSKAHLIGF